MGSDYCDALGINDSVEEANDDGYAYACDRWEGPEDEEESGIEDEGPDFYLEEYDPAKHDMLRAGGGSFADEFERMESPLAADDFPPYRPT